MTQKEQVINYLKPFGRTLTRLTCYKKFGFMTINSRVPEIKKMGINIKSKLVTKKGKTFSKYYIE